MNDDYKSKLFILFKQYVETDNVVTRCSLMQHIEELVQQQYVNKQIRQLHEMMGMVSTSLTNIEQIVEVKKRKQKKSD